MMKHFKHEARKLRLTAEEKAAMRARLFGLPGQGMPAQMPVRSPYVFVSLMRARVLVPSLAVLVVLAGSGTAYAAQGALPGNPLYAVKVNINEPVEVALAQGTAAKAAVEARIAQTRVAEAQALEAQGALTSTTTQELEQNFDEHAAQALALLGSTTPRASAEVALKAAQPAVMHTQELARHEAPTFAPAALPATSSEATATEPAEASTTENAENPQNIPDVLQRQREILWQIRQHVDESARRLPGGQVAAPAGPPGQGKAEGSSENHDESGDH